MKTKFMENGKLKGYQLRTLRKAMKDKRLTRAESRRVQAVFMRKNGLSRRQITESLTVSLSAVENWISAFNRRGLTGLKKRAQLSPPHLVLTRKEKNTLWQRLWRRKKVNVDFVKNLVKKLFDKEYKNIGSYYKILREVKDE